MGAGDFCSSLKVVVVVSTTYGSDRRSLSLSFSSLRVDCHCFVSTCPYAYVLKAVRRDAVRVHHTFVLLRRLREYHMQPWPR